MFLSSHPSSGLAEQPRGASKELRAGLDDAGGAGAVSPPQSLVFEKETHGWRREDRAEIPRAAQTRDLVVRYACILSTDTIVSRVYLYFLKSKNKKKTVISGLHFSQHTYSKTFPSAFPFCVSHLRFPFGFPFASDTHRDRVRDETRGDGFGRGGCPAAVEALVRCVPEYPRPAPHRHAREPHAVQQRVARPRGRRALRDARVLQHLASRVPSVLPCSPGVILSPAMKSWGTLKGTRAC